MKILAISGSLRADSSNSALLRAVAAMQLDGVEIRISQNIGTLPHFNPDYEPDDFPAVTEFRDELGWADLVLISSPEYAHGVPGVLKNALDWVVGTGEFMSKPVAFISPTGRGTYAQASLAETIRVMDARVLNPAGHVISLAHNGITTDQILGDPTLRVKVEEFLAGVMQDTLQNAKLTE